MSKFMFSSYIYKMMGFNDMETSLILQRNREEQKILTSDSRLLKSKRYEGLTDMDKSLAEQVHREFGHLTDPVLALELKYKKRNNY